MRLWLTHPCRLDGMMDIRIKYTRFVGTRTVFDIRIMKKWHQNTISNGYLVIIYGIQNLSEKTWINFGGLV
jgi:hypothetical protein